MNQETIDKRISYFDSWWELGYVAYRNCINPSCRLAVHGGAMAVFNANTLRRMGYDVTISLKQGPVWYMDIKAGN